MSARVGRVPEDPFLFHTSPKLRGIMGQLREGKQPLEIVRHLSTEQLIRHKELVLREIENNVKPKIKDLASPLKKSKVAEVREYGEGLERLLSLKNKRLLELRLMDNSSFGHEHLAEAIEHWYYLLEKYLHGIYVIEKKVLGVQKEG